MNLKKTKIIATIGPSSNKAKTLSEMIKNGMDVARLNFSHGTHKEKLEQIKLIRKQAENANIPIAIIADIQGPKLRLGQIEGTYLIKKGEILELSSRPTSNQLPCQFDLSPYVKKNHRIFLNDGLIEMVTLQVIGKTIIAKAINGGEISSKKGINIPDTSLGSNNLTSKDIEDIEFAINNKLEYIALSFVQNEKNIHSVKNILDKEKSITKIIAKIETVESLENLEPIIKSSDAVMVARGDLAIETSASQVPMIQQKITILARQHRKPIIIATHMLESMINNPRATRAEVSDIANAVLNQVDGVMLSAESASGKYPVESVKVMSETILSAESNLEYKHYIKIDWSQIESKDIQFNAITASAASLAYRIKTHIIAAATTSGRNAILLSSFRPDSHIVAITHNKEISNQLSLVWGITPLIIHPTKNSESFWPTILKNILKNKLAKKGDKIVMIGGSMVGVSGTTDTIKVGNIE